MKNRIPGPILCGIMKLNLCGISIAGAGCIWGISTQDRTTALLSMAVAVLCMIKGFTLYCTARDAAYDVFEGTVLASTPLPFHKKQTVILEQDEGQVTLILEGRTNFTLGTKYRIYTEKQQESLQTAKLPQALLPGRSLLGYEKVGENGSQKMM